MTTVNSARPPAISQPPAGTPAPMHVSLENDGGIEGILLELEEQSRRSRDLRNDARDARREQQAESIAETRKSAKLALAGALVKSVAETAASIATTAQGSDGTGTTEGIPSGGMTTSAASQTSASSAAAATGQGGAAGGAVGQGIIGLTEMSGSVIDHFAQKATTRAEVAEHAAETFGDVAEDAAQAEQDAQGMSDRALQHLEAILTARRDAEAAILRG